MQDTTIQSPLNSSQNDVKPARAAAGAALLCVLSMSSVQFGAALSAPTMAAYGSLSTTWLRLCWAALVLALLVRPRFRSYSRSHWMAAGALGAAMAGMTLCFFTALQRSPLGLAVAIDFLGPLAVATFAVRRARALLWPALAIAGGLAAKKRVPEGPGSFPTTGMLWISLLASVILIVGGLTFLPSLALGPIADHLQLFAH